MTAANEFGIFARVFPVGPAAQVAADVRAAGYPLAQLNLSALGLPTIPGPDDWACIDPVAITADFRRAGVRLWGLSASYNMAHPDPEIRSAGTRDAVALIHRAPAFGVAAVTLCTGSRNPDRMWASHPDNGTSGAWRDMRAELDHLLAAADEAGVLLGVEPEPGNVVHDADAARRLIDELGSDGRLIGIIADSANLLSAVPPAAHRRVLVHAFDALAPAVACVHAKDLVPWTRTLAGDGAIDHGLVGALWSALPQRPPVIVQDVAPDDAGAAREFLLRAFR